MEPWVKNLVHSMPKAELHLHLDGALRVKTALDLAHSSDWKPNSIPNTYQEMYKQMVVQGIPGSQKALLSYFRIPGLLLQTKEALYRAAYELIEDRASDGVRYCEVRWAPLLHTKRGLSCGQVIQAVLDGIQDSCAKTGVVAACIAVAMRNADPEENLHLLQELIPYQDKGLVAVDLAGVEQEHPDPFLHTTFFERAKEMGFYITFHAGEISSMTQNLKKAAERFLPRRIAHGSIAVQDKQFCSWLKKRGIMLDLCPTSNIQAGLYPDYEAFPLQRLYRCGVRISISTDDPVLSAISLSEEYSNILQAGQLSLRELWQVNLDALDNGFAIESEKKRLRNEFLQWADTIPELLSN